MEKLCHKMSLLLMKYIISLRYFRLEKSREPLIVSGSLIEIWGDSVLLVENNLVLKYMEKVYLFKLS